MNNFLVGLQFLTRIQLCKNLNWSPEACGGSVKFFPLIGTVLSFFYLLIGWLCFILLPAYNWQINNLLLGFVLLISNIFLTGALHCDGFCDTMDGILSGRQRDRILEIMKDSRVGAHGATSLILLLIGKFTMFASLTLPYALAILFFMPIIPRGCMSLAVVLFPYARPEGLGKAFHEYSSLKDLFFALGYIASLILLLSFYSLAFSYLIAFVSLATFLTMYTFNSHVNGLIQGLTGDVYGATTELGELIFLFFAVVFSQFLS